MTADIAGSWYPSGFYGHFRSKSRADFVCEYRQLARPPPPKKFLKRATQPIAKHVFSHHDNKQAFLNDALIFQHGLGRRRVPNSTYQFKQDFITWMPEREYVERSRPLTSTYRVDFNPTATKHQKITKRPKTSFDGQPTTSYRYSHGEDAPNKSTINAMNNDALSLSLLHRKDRAMSATTEGRASVASCLTWVTHKPPARQDESVRSLVPAATRTTVYEPHPPAAARPPSPVYAPPPVQTAWPTPQEAPPPQQQAPPPQVQTPPPIQQAPPALQPEPIPA